MRTLTRTPKGGPITRAATSRVSVPERAEAAVHAARRFVEDMLADLILVKLDFQMHLTAFTGTTSLIHNSVEEVIASGVRIFG